MVVETDDREERTDETESAPSADSALIGWLGAIQSEIREAMRELSDGIERLEQRVGRLEERVTRIEACINAERERKNRLIMWLGIGVGAAGALVGIGGVIVTVMGLLN